MIGGSLRIGSDRSTHSVKDRKSNAKYYLGCYRVTLIFPVGGAVLDELANAETNLFVLLCKYTQSHLPSSIIQVPL